jgi:hypothetical protein
MKAKSPAKPRRKPQWRSNFVYPGRLATVIGERIIELERGTFSIYAIELVCYDLRKRRNHSITGPLFQKSLEVQDAIDRQVIRNYRPFTRRRGVHRVAGQRYAPQLRRARFERRAREQGIRKGRLPAHVARDHRCPLA